MTLTLITGLVQPQITTNSIPTDITILLSSIQDPAAFGAPDTVQSDGTISLGGTTLTIDGTTDIFSTGQGLYLEGTGTGSLAGTVVTTIKTIISSTISTTNDFTLSLATSASLSGVLVLHDDAPSINLAIANGASLAGSGGYFQVNGGGRTYNLATPITPKSGLNLEDFRFTVLPSPNWIGGATTTPASTGVITIPSTVDNVVCRNIFIDIDRVPNVNGMVNYATQSILVDNCRVTRWTGSANGLYNAGKWNVAHCSFGQWGSGDPEASSPGYSNSGYALYEGGSDSTYSHTTFVQGYRPVYISSTAQNIRFDTCHTFPVFGQTPVATFMGSISGTTLSVSAVEYGAVAVGQTVFWPGTTIGSSIASATTISGEYILSSSETVASTSMTATQVASFIADFSGTTLDVSNLLSGSIFPGQSLSSTSSIAADTYILSQLPGTPPGGTGYYEISNSQTIASATLTATTPVANFVGTINGTTLGVSSINYGNVVPGQNIFSTGVTDGTVILSQTSGSTGGIGSYQINISQTLTLSTQMTGFQVQPAADITATINGTTLTVDSVISGILIDGMTLTGSGVASGTTVVGQGSSASTYLLNLGQTISTATQMTGLLPEGFANFEIYGNAIAISDHYLDSGNILIVNTTGTSSPSVDMDISMSIYNPPISPFSSSWVVASTSEPNTSLRNVIISPSSVFAGNYPILSFETIVASSSIVGSWTEFQTTIQSAQLAAQTQSMLTTNGGLLIAETSKSAGVATLLGNSTVATWLNFFDGSTTKASPPQVGSEGNDIVLRPGGGTAVAFRGSGVNGSAIIGNSPSGETFSTNTALSGTDSLAAFEVMHTGTLDPQGIIVNFSSAATNNKIDPAFGFQDTASSSFKTVIWSDGSVAHQVFGFNVSEFQTLAVSSMSSSGTFQVATFPGVTQLAGTYELEWIAGGQHQQHMIVAVGYHGTDNAGLITVLHNYYRGSAATISNPQIAQDDSNFPYFLVTLLPTANGTLKAQARGYNTGIALSSTLASGLTFVSTPEVALNQTGSGTGTGSALTWSAVSPSTLTSVTEKVKIEIDGTYYYLLATTLAT